VTRRPANDPAHLPEQADVKPTLLLVNLIVAAVYFAAIAFWFPHGSSTIVFGIFLAGEIFHLWQLATYLYTVWGAPPEHPFDATLDPAVDIFITVAGEPVELLAKTIAGAQRQDYAGEVRVVVLNDGLVAGKENWRDIELLAARMGVACITRQRQPRAAPAQRAAGCHPRRRPRTRAAVPVPDGRILLPGPGRVRAVAAVLRQPWQKLCHRWRLGAAGPVLRPHPDR